MPNLHFDPNARFDTGPNAAGCGRFSNQTAAAAAAVKGANFDGVIGGTTLRIGGNAAGVPRVVIPGNGSINSGPNNAGDPRSINNT